MSVNAPKKLKFHGEESFMCKKQKTKERFLMLSAETNVSKMQESVDVVALEPETVMNPAEMPKDAVQTTMTPPVMISVPNWEAMTCKEILAEIQSIQDMLMVSRFTQDVYNQYMQIIADGKSTYVRKCERDGVVITPHAPPQISTEEPTPTPTPSPTPSPQPTSSGVSTTTITTTGVPIIQSTGTFGGIKPPVGGIVSGGGGGAREQEKKKSNWWWILVVIGGAYLLLRRK